MNTKGIFGIVLLCTLAFSCSKEDVDLRPDEYRRIELTRSASEMVKPGNDLGLATFGAISETTDDNFVFSPFGVNTLLATLVNGDSGVTRDELLRAFGLPASEDGLATLQDYFRTINNALPTLDRSTRCILASSIWCDDLASLNPQFTATVKDVFSTDVKNQLPVDSKGVKAVNDWVSEKTSDMIRNFLSQPIACDFLAVNTTYFKGIWKDKFDVKNTKPGSFYNYDGTRADVDMMSNSFYTLAIADNDKSIAVLPYGNRNFQMVVAMPGISSSLSDLVDGLKESGIEGLLAEVQASPCRLNLEMPRFNVETRLDDLADVLKECGVGSISENGLNSILANGKTLFLNRMFQATSIRVDETGTEAAQAASGELITSPGPMEECNIVLNRPFMYLIRETSTGVILFMGQVTSF